MPTGAEQKQRTPKKSNGKTRRSNQNIKPRNHKVRQTIISTKPIDHDSLALTINRELLK